MRISITYPEGARKLYHRKKGQLIQICRNDGKVDNNFYIVTDRGSANVTTILNVVTGVLSDMSVSCRTIHFPDASIFPLNSENNYD